MTAGRQDTTDADAAKWPLTPQQEAAVDLLSIGRTVTETADAVGVARQTVSEWLHRHAGFKASLNRRRQETWESLVDDLRSLAPKAVRVLQEELERDGRSRLLAAVHVLKASGLYGLVKPDGATDATDLDTADRERRQERRWAAMVADFDPLSR
jgi:hypothetical protein